MRSLLLLVTVVFCATAALTNCNWGWLGIDENLQAYRMWLALAGGTFAASFFPWEAWGQRWHR